MRSVLVNDPHEKTRLALYLRADKLIAAQEAEPPLRSGPIDLDPLVGAERLYCAQWNPILEQLQIALRDSVAKQIDAMAKPGLVGRYDHPLVKPVFDELLEGRRARLSDADQVRLGLEAIDRDRMRPARAIVYYVKYGFRDQNPGKSDDALNVLTAAYLSHVKPTQGRIAEKEGTSRSHVRRAEQACKAWLHRRVNATPDPALRDLIIRAFDQFWSLRVGALLGIEQAALKDERYRKLGGAALADAIERDGGMYRAFIRVLELNERRRRAGCALRTSELSVATRSLPAL